MRGSPHFSADGESLQTDVMRFMAIIAFCLIAILALVRNVEPALPAGHEAQAARVPATAAASAADLLARPDPPTPADTQASPDPLAPSQPLVRADPPPRPAPQPASASAAAPPLSLRFASDRDFLNLVANGTIRVFAYRPREVLGLDADFQFRASESPGKVYELLPETIPAAIVGVLRGTVADAESFTWAVRIPPSMDTTIRGFIERGMHGELVIDRYGRVRHVAG